MPSGSLDPDASATTVSGSFPVAGATVKAATGGSSQGRYWIEVTAVPESAFAAVKVTPYAPESPATGVHVSVPEVFPEPATNTPIAQLTIYALALTRLVPGLKLFDIKCAWFNENEYCEFFPRKLFTARHAIDPTP